MKLLQAIRSRLKKLTQSKRSDGITKHWVYKLTVDQVSLIFDANDISCFGWFFRVRKLKRFVTEYDDLFNMGEAKKQFNESRYFLKMYTKHLKLRAMYEALASCEDAENSKAEFKRLFKKDYEGVKDLLLITDESARLNDKMGSSKERGKSDDLSFSQLLSIVEASRGFAIDKDTKLYRFYEIYKIELEKWHKT